MATIRVYSYAVVEIDGQTYVFGSLSTPVSITAASGIGKFEKFSIAASGTATLWDDGNNPSDFDFLLIASDQDIQVQFVVDDDGDVAEKSFTLPVEGTGTANSYGVPLILPADDSYAGDFTVDFGAGTLDVIDRITCKNNGSSTANVIVWAVT